MVMAKWAGVETEMLNRNHILMEYYITSQVTLKNKLAL